MRMRRVVLSFAALALTALVPFIARAQPPAPVRATLFTSTVQWTTAPGTSVRVVLRDAQRVKSTANATADAGGEVTASFPQTGGPGGGDNTIRADDQIGIHPSVGTPFTRTVPALEVGVDPIAREVSGTAPAGAPLEAVVYRPDDTEAHSTTITAAGDGSFSLAIPQGVDVVGGAWGTITFTTADGDRFAARWDVLTAQVTIGSAAISGRGTLGSTVRAELGAGGAIKGTTGNNPTTILRTATYNLTFRQGFPTQAVAVGDLITVTHSGAIALTGQMPAITVQVDAAADRVTGSAPPNAELVVSVPVAGGDPVSVSTTTDGAGDYTASFQGLVDLEAGATVYTAYTEGFITYRAVGVVEQVRAVLYSAQVQGSAASGTEVSASLYEAGAGGALLAADDGTAGGNGTFQLNLTAPGGGSVRTAPGNRLVVSFGSGGAPVEIVLPDLTASADADADTVSGTAPSNAVVTVSTSGFGGETVETSADGTGAYVASFAGLVDIVPGSTGTIVVAISGGHTVSMPWSLPRVDVTLGSAAVSGVGPNGRSVDATLRRGGGAIGSGSTTVGGGGGGFGGGSNWNLTLNAAGGAGGPVPVPVQAGDRLAVSVADWSLDLVVPEVTIEIDANADVVSGRAPANGPVSVTASRQGPGNNETVETTAGPDGRYEADFAGQWEFAPGDSVAAVATLDGGHTVTVEGGMPGLIVYLDTGVVSGTATPNASVSATLRESSGAVRGTGQAQAGGNRQYELQLEDGGGNAVEPAAGDVLTVQYGATTLTMPIPTLTVDYDVDADTVSGQTTPGGTLSVHAVPAFGGQGSDGTVTGTPASDGTYSLSFAGEVDIRAGTLLEVGYTTSEGYVARVDRRVPIAHVQQGGNLINGYVARNASVTASLRRAGSGLSTATTTAGPDGAFQVRFMTNTLQPVKIEAGDVVDVRWTGGGAVLQPSTGQIVATVAGLTATVDAASRVVSGTAAPNATVYLSLSFGGGGVFNLTTTAEPDGSYSRPFGGGGGSLNADFTVEVGTLDEPGHRTYITLVVPYLELTMGSAEILGHASPLTPLSLTLSEGGQTIGQASLASTVLGDFTAILNPTMGSPVRIATGQLLTLEEPHSGTTSVEVPTLTIELDAVAHVLRGTGPADANLPLRLYPPSGDPVDLQTQTDDSGAWSIDDSDLPPGATFTLADLARADARLTVGNGHRVIAIAYPAGVPTPTPGVDEGNTIFLPMSIKN